MLAYANTHPMDRTRITKIPKVRDMLVTNMSQSRRIQVSVACILPSLHPRKSTAACIEAVTAHRRSFAARTLRLPPLPT